MTDNKTGFAGLSEKTLARMMSLILMDNILRENMNDEDVFMRWLEGGVPDASVANEDYGILEFMAQDEEIYKETSDLYEELLEIMQEG